MDDEVIVVKNNAAPATSEEVADSGAREVLEAYGSPRSGLRSGGFKRIQFAPRFLPFTCQEPSRQAVFSRIVLSAVADPAAGGQRFALAERPACI